MVSLWRRVTNREEEGYSVPELYTGAVCSRGSGSVGDTVVRVSLYTTAYEDADPQMESGSVALPNARAYVRYVKSLCQHSPEPTADELGKGHPKSARLPAHLRRACPPPASRRDLAPGTSNVARVQKLAATNSPRTA